MDRRGLTLGVSAYLMWAVFPLYFVLLRPAGPVEIIAHRIVWSALFCAVLLSVTRGWGRVRRIMSQGRLVAVLGLAGVLVACNWLIYVYAALSDHVVEASLGYFINPLVTALLAVVVLRERLTRPQWIALAIGALAVAVITVGYGAFPWISFGLALSFGCYGLVKKQAGRTVGALEGLAIETGLVAPLALGYLAVLAATGTGHFATEGGWHALAMAGCGAITAVPLLAFNAAARRLPLTTIALLQYLAPIGQFIIGVTVFHETMSGARWAGFALVWVALIVITVDAWRTTRRAPRPTPAPPS